MKKIEELTMWLKNRSEACILRSAELTADHRADEGNFQKIRANVYDIFRTVLAAGGKNCGEDASEIRAFVEKRLNEIPANWEIAYEKAVRHGDTRAQHIESLKLDVVRETREAIARIWRE